MIYQIKRQLELAVGINEAWEFFSDPNNLKTITPPSLNMKITCELPKKVYPGLIITYKVHPILSIPLNWVTEITHVKKPFLFVDEQRYGPYRMWHHQHHFRETPAGVVVEDIVDYIMPCGIFGCIPHSLFVRNQVNQIFDYRTKVLEKRFGFVTALDKSTSTQDDSFKAKSVDAISNTV